MNDIEEQIADVCETVWGLSLNMGIDRLDFEECGLENEGQGDSESAALRASILLTGDVESTLTFDCNPEVARMAAGVMFDLALTEVTSEDMHDSICELVNVVAGNVRGLFDGNLGISTPVLEDGHLPLAEASEVFGQVAFECNGFPFRIRVATHNQS